MGELTVHIAETQAKDSPQSSIEASFSSVVDLPESDIVHTLITLVKLRRQQSVSGDAMQVDGASASDLPSLPSFLSPCVTYPNATSKGIVLGLKKWVRDPEDAAAIAQVLESWMRSLGQQRKTNGEVGLLPSNKDLEKNEHGVWVVAADKKVKKGKDAKKALPPLPKVSSSRAECVKATVLIVLRNHRWYPSCNHSWMRASFSSFNTPHHTSSSSNSKHISSRKLRSLTCSSSSEDLWNLSLLDIKRP